VEYSEETKLKFYDYQAALRADLIVEDGGDSLQLKSLSKSLTVKMQSVAHKVWLEEDLSDKKKRSGGKLGVIEDHLDDIVTDVKANLNAMFNRGV